MINKRTVFEMYRLKDFGFSRREIARQLNIDRATVAKYLDNPDPAPRKRARKISKLEPYRDELADMLKQFPAIKAPVVMQRLKEKGFDGEITIVRNLLRQLRGQTNCREPFIRFESDPGVQVQVDWGHFNSLSYKGGNRKLYALAVIESHSRMLYVTFTHSQKQEQLHMGLLDAFRYFGGCPKEIVVDNMLTAVGEAIRLKLEHIESDPSRMVIRVERGKGRKDRFTVLSEKLLCELRAYWQEYSPEYWLFPGQKPGTHITSVSVSKFLYAAKKSRHIQRVQPPYAAP